MNASNHGHHAWVKGGVGIAVVVALAGAAQQASRHFGVLAGAAVVTVVFAACWIVHRVRPLLHPVSQAPREPQLPAQAGNAPATSSAPDLLPVL